MTKKNKQKNEEAFQKIISRFPKTRTDLPEEYLKIFDEHYKDSREGRTRVTAKVSKVETWLHKQVLRSADKKLKTLEIGAGNLNHLDYEQADIYDIVEPYRLLFEDSEKTRYVRNIYDDVKDIPDTEKYDRIISIACFEHICDLPQIVEKCARLLTEDGCLCVSIPNEGRFLWHLAYTVTTGREFKKKFGLDYERWMRYEHVNTADEIDIILRHYFDNVRMRLCGIGKNLSIYRFYECRK